REDDPGAPRCRAGGDHAAVADPVLRRRPWRRHRGHDRPHRKDPLRPRAREEAMAQKAKPGTIAKTATAKTATKPKPGLPSFPGGMQMVYGIGIGDALAALAKDQASADDLVALRDQARAIVGAQGDL